MSKCVTSMKWRIKVQHALWRENDVILLISKLRALVTKVKHNYLCYSHVQNIFLTFICQEENYTQEQCTYGSHDWSLCQLLSGLCVSKDELQVYMLKEQTNHLTPPKQEDLSVKD